MCSKLFSVNLPILGRGTRVELATGANLDYLGTESGLVALVVNDKMILKRS